MKMKRWAFTLLAVGWATALASAPLLARTVRETTGSEPKSEETDRANMAAEVLESALMGPDAQIPNALLKKATGVAVIPHVVKGAFILGGQYGKGLVSQRLASGKWTPPAYVGIGGASYGLQAGVQAVDLILVFVGGNAIQDMMRDKLKLGANAEVTAGPVGRSAQAGVDVALKTGIFSYSRSKGVFAGVSLDGAVLSFDDTANERVYGKDVTGNKLLGDTSGAVAIPQPVESFTGGALHRVPKLDWAVYSHGISGMKVVGNPERNSESVREAGSS